MKTLLAAIVFVASAACLRAEDAKPAAYPLTTCVVSGEKLGGMGAPAVVTYEGRQIELCCSGCKKSFDKDPAKYMKVYDAAVAAKKDAK